MREFAITPQTAINMLLTGMRIRIHKNREQLAQLLSKDVNRVVDWETGVLDLPVSEFVEVMERMGVRIIGQAPALTGQLTSHRLLVDDESEPEPEPEAQPDESDWRVAYLPNPDALAHVLRMARLRSGKLHREVADDLGINQTTYSRHEREGGNITLEILSAYSNYFKIRFVMGPKPHE